MLPPNQIYLALITALTVIAFTLGLNLDAGANDTALMTALNLFSSALLATMAASILYYRHLNAKEKPESKEALGSTPALALEPITAPITAPGFNTDHAQRYLDQVHTLVLVLDHLGQVVYLNQHGYRLLGYPQGSLQNAHWLQLCVPSRHHPHIINALEQHRNNIALAPMCVEHPVLNAEGEQLIIAWDCSSITVDKGYRQLLCAGRDVTENSKIQAQIEHLEYQDQLTNLPNRRTFLQQLQITLETCHKDARTLTLFYLNLDHFKRVNNSLGQKAGDQLLRRIAEILRREIRTQDLICRHSSDEFLLALHDLDPDQAAEFARRINRLIRQPITFIHCKDSPHSKLLTTSIGISRFPRDCQDAATLIKFADLAMHRVKQADRNGYLFFHQKMHDELEAEQYLEQELHRAIKNDEFVLFYQPQVDLNNPQVMGMEALVRWQHPERGMIPPDEFIAIAERSGLIIALGQLVLRKACSGYQMLDTLGLGYLRIAINLSALQFRDPLFPRMFQQILSEFKVKPSQIELELTESMLMTNIDEAIQILTQLKQLGSTLAIDDFGTGYSSLSYLKQLPVDIIKVDRSFVKDIPQDQSDMEITAAVIAMAHKLKRKVVAEGVETPEQEQFLRDNECEYAQGYLYSPPVPEAELPALIHRINGQLRKSSNNCVQLEFDTGQHD